MNRRAALAICVGLALIKSAAAQQAWPPASATPGAVTPGTNLSTGNVTATGGSSSLTLANLASQLYSIQAGGFAVAPGSIALVSGGSGYNDGDVVTLTCAGCSITTNPTVTVGVQSGNVAQTVIANNLGVLTNAPATNPVTFTQSSTTGSGTGLVITAKFGVIAAATSYPALATGGGLANGDMFIGALTNQANFAGSESVFIGSLAGGCLSTGAGNVVVGHNALGTGNSLPCSNTPIANNSVIIGQDAIRNFATAGGSLNYSVVLGSQAGHNLVGGSTNNVIIGYGVASSTLTNGTNNILIGVSSGVDTAASNTSNTINIGNIMTTTGTGTPLSSVTQFAGTLMGTAPSLGNKALKGCQTAACSAWVEIDVGGRSGAAATIGYWNGSAYANINTPGPFEVDNKLLFNSLASNATCASSASPAVCTSAPSGSVAVPTGTNPTLVVDTSAVTSGSQILLTVDESLGTALGVTCNTTISTLSPAVVTARTAGTSFTVEIGATVATNPVCLNYTIVN